MTTKKQLKEEAEHLRGENSLLFLGLQALADGRVVWHGCNTMNGVVTKVGYSDLDRPHGGLVYLRDERMGQRPYTVCHYVEDELEWAHRYVPSPTSHEENFRCGCLQEIRLVRDREARGQK